MIYVGTIREVVEIEEGCLACEDDDSICLRHTQVVGYRWGVSSGVRGQTETHAEAWAAARAADR